jgi:hypothetical protein
VTEKQPEHERRNGKLKIELEFEDALRAALETKPPRPAPKKKRKNPKR